MDEGLRDLKAIERRTKIRKYIRQGLLQTEMADKLEVNVTTISDDIQIIRQENVQKMLSNKRLIEEDIRALLESIAKLNDIEDECWKIYEEKIISVDANGQPQEKSLSAGTRLEALDKIKQVAKDRAQLLKLLNPTQINVEKLVVIDKVFNLTIQKITEIVLQYIPENKKVELLTKIEKATIEIEGEING
jgi:F0F1-type ATP synthase delta subunit